MRKDLQEAQKLASEQHDLDYYKLLLSTFMEQKEADLKAQQAAAEAKAAKQAAKVKKDKSKSQKIIRDDDDDVEMADGDSDEVNSVHRKRKAEEEATVSTKPLLADFYLGRSSRVIPTKSPRSLSSSLHLKRQMAVRHQRPQRSLLPNQQSRSQKSLQQRPAPQRALLQKNQN
jgi:hypothetical protein